MFENIVLPKCCCVSEVSTVQMCAERCKMSIAKVGLDTAENEPPEVSYKIKNLRGVGSPKCEYQGT